MLENENLNPEEFRIKVLNKLRLDYQIYDNPISIINIDTRSNIITSILNWLHTANALDILKKPIIRISDEE